jgi:predicted nucleic acid-binding protein
MAKTQSVLFDTVALIDIFRGRESLRSRYEEIVGNEVEAFISSISEAELWRGAQPNETERHEALLAQFVVLPLDSESARTAGLWMKKYEPQGLGWMDALIAATAKHAKLTVLTRDGKLARVLRNEVTFELYEA